MCITYQYYSMCIHIVCVLHMCNTMCITYHWSYQILSLHYRSFLSSISWAGLINKSDWTEVTWSLYNNTIIMISLFFTLNACRIVTSSKLSFKCNNLIQMNSHPRTKIKRKLQYWIIQMNCDWYLTSSGLPNMFNVIKISRP